MYNDTYYNWILLHNNEMMRKKLPDAIYKSWQKSHALGIDHLNSTPKMCSADEFYKNYKKWQSLHYYAKNALTTASQRFDDFNFILALFDNNGCLIKIYGDKDSLHWAKKNKIEDKSIWDENAIGTNAVSLGLKLRHSVSVIGEEHYCKFAINLAMYFSPIIFEKDTKDNSEYGGIAIIVPVENKNSSFILTADSIARGVALHFFWFESVNLFLNSVNGYLVVNQLNAENEIIFISKEVFDLLKITYKDMYYRNLEEIIDPYPENKEFWNIVNNKIRVQDLDMKMSVQGTQVKINFSVRPFYGRNFHIEGISIILNSRERIQNLISKHTGNNANFTFSQIIGKNERFLNLLSQAKAAAQSTVNVLLLGESGVGKDIIAQSIHNASDRRDKPFIAVNCASFPKDLISSELFGYEDGAFTGSKKGGNIGKFELANNGTIFLDEIGDMPLDLQAILLRVIEQKSFMKIGSINSTNIDVRIIAATNKNLKEKIERGEFREDLFYRLGIIKLVIPPLRNRKDDILLLSKKFIENICTRINKPIVPLSPNVEELFMNYEWPGNIRELKNLLEGVIQIYDTPVITYDQISNSIMLGDNGTDKSSNNATPQTKIETNLNDNNGIIIKPFKPNSKECIIHALEINKNNKTNTAKYLGISRKTLYNRLKEYNLL